MADNKKKLKIGLYILFALIFLVLCMIQINKPISSDQLYFAYTAKALLKTGLPEMQFTGYGFPKMSGLAHPPAYIYLLFLSTKILGYNLFGLKIVSIIFAILTSLIIFLFANKLYPDKKYLGLIAAVIYLLHPFVIQNSLILDMDGGILSFTTILAFLYFCRYKLEKPFILSLLLFLVIWTKFTSIIILFLVFFLYFLFFEKKKMKNIGKIILIFAAVGVVFLLTFYIYTSIIGGDFLKPFRQNTDEKFLQRITEGLFQSFARSAYSFKDFIMWLTPPIFLYLLIILYMYARDFKNKKQDHLNKLYFLFFVVNIGFFVLSGVEYIGFAKHYILVVPILAIAMAKDIEENKRKLNKKQVLAILVSMLVLFNYYYFIIGDPFFTQDIWRVYQHFDYSVIWLVALKIFLIVLPAFVLFFIFERKARRALIVTSLVFIIYASLYTSIATYSTNIHYGDCCLDEVVSYVENLTGNQTATIIGLHQFNFIYNKGGDYDEINNNAYMYSAGDYYIHITDFFDKVKLTPDNTYLIMYAQDKYRRAGFIEHLKENFDFLKQIGYYEIYKYKF